MPSAAPPAPTAVSKAPRSPTTPFQLELDALQVGGPDPFILTIRQPAKICTPHYGIGMCGCELQPQRVCDLQKFAHTKEPPPHFRRMGKLRLLPMGACMALDCTRCHPDVSRRRGDRIKQRLDVARAGGPVAESVFTLPPRLRGRMADKATWLTFRREAWRILQRHAGAKLAVGCSHPVGDKNPDKFHPHVHFLWIGARGQQVHLSKPTIDRIRKAWAELLNVHQVDFHHSYVKGAEGGRLFHRCRYIARSFPGFGKWCGQVAWFGDPPTVKFRSVKECPTCHQVVRVIGTASTTDFELWKLGHPPPVPQWLLTWDCRPNF